MFAKRFIGYCDNRAHIRIFRLDRINNKPEVMVDQEAIISKSFDAAEFSKKVFRMYDTDEETEVVLKCETHVMKAY